MKLYFNDMTFGYSLDDLENAIKRVREIHKSVEYHGQVFCSVCSYDGIPESLAYPCPTIKALDGEQ